MPHPQQHPLTVAQHDRRSRPDLRCIRFSQEWHFKSVSGGIPHRRKRPETVCSASRGRRVKPRRNLSGSARPLPRPSTGCRHKQSVRRTKTARKIPEKRPGNQVAARDCLQKRSLIRRLLDAVEPGKCRQCPRSRVQIELRVRVEVVAVSGHPHQRCIGRVDCNQREIYQSPACTYCQNSRSSYRAKYQSLGRLNRTEAVLLGRRWHSYTTQSSHLRQSETKSPKKNSCKSVEKQPKINRKSHTIELHTVVHCHLREHLCTPAAVSVKIDPNQSQNSRKLIEKQ